MAWEVMIFGFFSVTSVTEPNSSEFVTSDPLIFEMSSDP